MDNNDGSFQASVTDIGISVYQHKTIEKTGVVYMLNIPILEETYSQISIAVTPMAHSPWLIQTRF